LWLASVNGNPKTIAMLLEGGADAGSANADGETALMVAARTGKTDAVNLLLARGADPNGKEGWRGQTALMWAAAEGHAAVIDLLVARGADLKDAIDGRIHGAAVRRRARAASPPSRRCSRPAPT
jgi:ankyrin repeat protein